MQKDEKRANTELNTALKHLENAHDSLHKLQTAEMKNVLENIVKLIHLRVEAIALTIEDL